MKFFAAVVGLVLLLAVPAFAQTIGGQPYGGQYHPAPSPPTTQSNHSPGVVFIPAPQPQENSQWVSHKALVGFLSEFLSEKKGLNTGLEVRGENLMHNLKDSHTKIDAAREQYPHLLITYYYREGWSTEGGGSQQSAGYRGYSVHHHNHRDNVVQEQLMTLNILLINPKTGGTLDGDTVGVMNSEIVKLGGSAGWGISAPWAQYSEHRYDNQDTVFRMASKEQAILRLAAMKAAVVVNRWWLDPRLRPYFYGPGGAAAASPPAIEYAPTEQGAECYEHFIPLAPGALEKLCGAPQMIRIFRNTPQGKILVAETRQVALRHGYDLQGRLVHGVVFQTTVPLRSTDRYEIY